MSVEEPDPVAGRDGGGVRLPPIAYPILAVLFGLPETSVEVVAPDVGGGFGPKIMLFNPDELLVPYAAMKLGRPVKWTEGRREHFAAMGQIGLSSLAMFTQTPEALEGVAAFNEKRAPDFAPFRGGS